MKNNNMPKSLSEAIRYFSDEKTCMEFFGAIPFGVASKEPRYIQIASFHTPIDAWDEQAFRSGMRYRMEEFH